MERKNRIQGRNTAAQRKFMKEGFDSGELRINFNKSELNRF